MTCREKYVKDHPGMLLCITRSGCIPPECPADYGYLEDPSYCELDVACRMCWDREIPGTENEEKENEDMSEAPCGLNYEAEYNRLLEENLKLHDMRVKNERQRELDLIALKEQASVIEKYEFGFRVVEAFLGTKILEDYE